MARAPKEITERTEQIIAVSGLSDFTDLPHRTYSHRMGVRLASP
jgi:ABC-type polysaccharide/polyol phosphate transport system ATPase subunit